MKYNAQKNKIADSIEPIEKARSNTILLFILICFVFITGITMCFHEMWRDEYQAWLISSFSGSITELFANIHYEGHPAGWFLILYFLSGLTSDPVVMQIAHLVISTASVFLILRYAPFTLLEKTLLISGYFFIYEYTVISRNYSVSILLIILICIQITRHKINPWLTGVFLFLLCNTNLYGGIVAAVFTLYLFINIFDTKIHMQAMNLLIILVFVLAGLILLYLQIEPASLVQANDYYKWKNGFSIDRLIVIGSKLFNVFFAIPSLEVNGSFVKNIISDNSIIKCIVVLIPVAITVWSLKNNKGILSMFLSGIIVLLVILYFNNNTSLRHEGFLFVVFISTLWLFRNSDIGKNKFQPVLKKVFMIILIVQSSGGLIAIGKDILYPFSNLREAGRYIVKHNYDKHQISGMADYIVSPITGFTRKPVYVPETRKEIHFIVWSDNRIENDQNLYSLVNRADSIVTNTKRQCLIIFTQAIRNANGEILTEAPISPHSNLLLLKKFDKPNIVGDENYYLYQVITN